MRSERNLTSCTSTPKWKLKNVWRLRIQRLRSCVQLISSLQWSERASQLADCFGYGNSLGSKVHAKFAHRSQISIWHHAAENWESQQEEAIQKMLEVNWWWQIQFSNRLDTRARLCKWQHTMCVAKQMSMTTSFHVVWVAQMTSTTIRHFVMNATRTRVIVTLQTSEH